MSKEENLATQALGGEIAASRQLSRLKEVFAEDVLDHDAGPDAVPGVQGIIDWWEQVATAFPDFTLDVDALTTDDDNIAFAYRLAGTHQGEFLGFAPTGRHFEVRGLQIGRFVDGKIVERWGATDLLGLLAQLGLVTLPATS